MGVVSLCRDSPGPQSLPLAPGFLPTLTVCQGLSHMWWALLGESDREQEITGGLWESVGAAWGLPGEREVALES